ncbi:hypothetical protein VNO80_02710 [Phaseolus coccineus]|uniref:Uncharacterized protein n=1 Tax=Phaseolus coccineus TaxID=3886 RepID=A0AAN9NXD1_PHACN
MPHALAMSACLSRAGDIRMSRALAMTDDNRHVWLKVLHPTMLRPRVRCSGLYSPCPVVLFSGHAVSLRGGASFSALLRRGGLRSR